ncbi:hypothetical protein DFH07DRAFT_783178 [Mycena maculata]|uniref:Uncharacterized protein n=1 Tax=Mycena maculata TaxID=230809 RepID=A0AAD7MMS9_9AGAR|nr:hypothetical protein DFH07DRAFT_783178 [Mycena maculata]
MVLWAHRSLNEKDTTIITSLLTFILERGEETPLNLRRIYGREKTDPHALHLLATHSERWKTIDFLCSFSDFQHLGSAEGKFPQLETLVLHNAFHYGRTPPDLIDVFKVAPNLKYLALSGFVVPVIVTPPLHQLTTFRCLDLGSKHANAALSWFIADGEMPPCRSKPGHAVLSMETSRPLFRSNLLNIFNIVFHHLTLPSLLELVFAAEEYPASLLPWPHPKFLSLSERSSFSNNLCTLRLHHFLITKADLLESLDALPSESVPGTMGGFRSDQTVTGDGNCTISGCFKSEILFHYQRVVDGLLKEDLEASISSVDRAPTVSVFKRLRGSANGKQMVNKRFKRYHFSEPFCHIFHIYEGQLHPISPSLGTKTLIKAGTTLGFTLYTVQQSLFSHLTPPSNEN